VPDGLDKCPNTPAGTKVDATGCPLPVEAVKPQAAVPPSAPGKCPPAPPGSQVDANGCLILFAPEAARSPTPGAPPRPTLILTGVNFETGRSVLTRDSYLVLDAVAASLLANPDIRIEVAGYTDSTGRKYINYRLSQRRAAPPPSPVGATAASASAGPRAPPCPAARSAERRAAHPDPAIGPRLRARRRPEARRLADVGPILPGARRRQRSRALPRARAL